MRNHAFNHPARAALLVLALSGLCLCLPVKGANAEEGTGNMVFFKGGFVGMNSNRGGQFFTDCGLNPPSTCGQNNSSTGWYVGAGLDLVLSKDIWGMMNKT
jgi:hypothetical protein